ncbi:MAG: phage tail sheath protein [Mucilaginibacter sp.]|nr:phage tail sheath protein [Mucilaginibacter sp.]
MSQINESTLRTPGVYVNEIPSFPPSIAQVATAIPAFIGYTQIAKDSSGNDLTNKPTKISSLLEYELYFGKAQLETGIQITYLQVISGKVSTDTISFAFAANTKSRHIMHSAIRHFYANGGGFCYIVSIGAYKAAINDALVLTDFYNAGTGVGLEAIAKESEPTLIVFPEGQNMASNADYLSLQAHALDQCGSLQDRFCIMDMYDTGETLITTAQLQGVTDDFRNTLTPADPNNINYGAVYFPNLKTVYSYDYDESKILIAHHTITDGAAPVAGAFDGHFLKDVNTPGNAAYSSSGYNTLKTALNTQFPIVMPPSPAMAGIYAAVDGSRGVWKAPANVGVLDVTKATFQISDELQQSLNIDPGSGRSINAIRAFTGKGILVWGARTLDGSSNDFRYISVRRFYIMVEESVKLAAMQFVFEPNDGHTWVRIRAMIENYLTNLWRLGALAGSKPEQAFYVKVGLGQTMIFDDILNGKLIVEIGMAPVRPAEFIILRFSQIQQQA